MQSYRTNLILADEIQVIVNGYISAGLIRHYRPPWVSFLVVVQKENDKIRLTVNCLSHG